MQLNHNKQLINLISVSITSTIRQVMQTIDKGGLGFALLIENETEKFVGVVTDGDIRRALLQGYGLESNISTIPRPESKTGHITISSEQITSLFSEPVRVIPLLDDAGKVADLALFDKRVRLPVAEPSLGEKELSYVTECVLTGWVSSAGKFVTRFEEMFAEFCNTKYAIATSNGTTALHLAVLALDIGVGDEVIVPTLSFIATANAVTYTGAKPVFVDSEWETWNIDPNLIEQAITPKTKAIIPVHLYGHPANMDLILDISKRHNLAVIEDAAEAHGAKYKGQPVGGIGEIGVFSFYGNKIITTGEGGMVVTNDSEIAKKIRILRGHGMSPERRYWHPVLGYNYRMTNLQAALGVGQMERIDEIIEAKLRIAERYEKGFSSIKGLNLAPRQPWAKSVFWLYSILVNEDEFGLSRGQLVTILQEKGIETRPLFIPIHQQPVYHQNVQDNYPVANQLGKIGLSLPSAASLQLEDINKVINCFQNF